MNRFQADQLWSKIIDSNPDLLSLVSAIIGRDVVEIDKSELLHEWGRAYHNGNEPPTQEELSLSSSPDDLLLEMVTNDEWTFGKEMPWVKPPTNWDKWDAKQRMLFVGPQVPKKDFDAAIASGEAISVRKAARLLEIAQERIYDLQRGKSGNLTLLGVRQIFIKCSGKVAVYVNQFEVLTEVLSGEPYEEAY